MLGTDGGWSGRCDGQWLDEGGLWRVRPDRHHAGGDLAAAVQGFEPGIDPG